MAFKGPTRILQRVRKIRSARKLAIKEMARKKLLGKMTVENYMKSRLYRQHRR